MIIVRKTMLPKTLLRIKLMKKPVVMSRMTLFANITRFSVIIQIQLRVYKLQKLLKLLQKRMKLYYNQISLM